MTTKLSNAARSAACNAITALIDAGAGGGTITIYPTPQVGGPDTATGLTPLATLTFSTTSFGAAVNGVATASAITNDSSVDAGGTAVWGRICADGGNPATAGIIDFSIGLTGSGADVIFDSTTFIAGGTAAITSLTLTVPASE